MLDCSAPVAAAAARPLDGPEADAELAAFAKALGHPARVRILRLLARERRCLYGDIADDLPLAQSTVSEHLRVLRAAGLVQGSVEGPRVCYCVQPDALRRLHALVGALETQPPRPSPVASTPESPT